MIETLNQAFVAIEDTLMKNIASHIIEYEFHAEATEETLIAYYGGAYVNRDELLRDTLHRLNSDQMKLRFLTEKRSNLYTTYGNENATGDISGTIQRATGVSPQPESVATDAAEDGAEQSTDESVRSGNDADEGSDSTK